LHRYSQDGTDHNLQFLEMLASRKGRASGLCQVMIREVIAAAALIPQDDLTALKISSG